MALPVAAAAAALLLVPIGHAVLGAGTATGSRPASLLPHLLLAVVVVVGAAALGGAVAEKLGQPRVFGELITGLLMGPTALGALAPQAQGWLFPSMVLTHLDSMAQLGVALFMFLVGLEVSLNDLRRAGATSMAIGHSAIALPFFGGVVLSWWLYTRYRPDQPGTTAFALFIGLCFAVTAFPVLARILDEQNLMRTRLGSIGMGAAGICDLTAWSLLAVVVTIAHQSSVLPAVRSVVLAVVFTVAMLTLVRALLARLLARIERSEQPPVAIYAGLVCFVLAAALATEAIGVHAIFGAFLAGIVMPRDSALVTGLATKLHGVTMWVLLPLFFVVVGVRTDLGLAVGTSTILATAVIITVAVATKVIGAAGAALVVGEQRRDALALGIMMNCRGLTELIVLNLGRQLGILNSTLFAIFVVMAVVTTGLTGPLLRAVTRSHSAPKPLSPSATADLSQ
ncbi:cation:proton antiporter domain-containing protein [Nocardia takedensis]|uniref:cation:proton antiporter domain-containing protein n=1 Tax=Nocardia takedensis TaxID=259390 RepID=UPI003F76F622